MYLTSAQPCPEPTRIISLVPSITELLVDLGLREQLVGITKFCVHPPDLRLLTPTIGGTKKINVSRITRLSPTLIIANKEENVKEQLDELAANYPVWLTDVASLEDAYQMINDLGNLCHRQTAALGLIENIKTEFAGLQQSQAREIPAAYLIWRNPYMTVGGDTYISSMMQLAGYRNVFADKLRYPVVKIADLRRSGCSTIFLSSEPFPFKTIQQQEIMGLLPGVEVILVDGEMFSWYGSRLLRFPSYLSALKKDRDDDRVR